MVRVLRVSVVMMVMVVVVVMAEAVMVSAAMAATNRVCWQATVAAVAAVQLEAAAVVVDKLVVWAHDH